MKGWKKLRGEGHEVVGRRGLNTKPPSARNNKQAFSYSNKYQASGEHGGAADEEEAKGESQPSGWLLFYTEAFLGSWPGREEQSRQ